MLVDRGNLWLALFFCVFGSVLIIWTFTTSIGQNQKGPVGPWDWPRAVLVMLVLVALVDLIAEFRTGLRAASVPQEPSETAADTVVSNADRSRLRLLVAILLVVGYVSAVLVIGFLLASFAFVLLFIFLGGYRRLVWAPVVAAVASLAITSMFVKVVYISLPLGIGVFQDIEVALYRMLHLF